MAQFYDIALLALFIVVVCVFMVCCQKRTRRENERNAKIFEMRAASPGDMELEYEDINSDEVDNDNNDDIELMEKQKNHCDNKEDGGILSDSTEDEMSMERMREEYYKAQTFSKKVGDLLDDIRDILKTKQTEIQNKFTKKQQIIVAPMAMHSQSTMHSQTSKNSKSKKSLKQSKKKNRNESKEFEVRIVEDANVEDNVDFDSECDEKVKENV